MHNQQQAIKEAITSYEAALKRVDEEIVPLQQTLMALLYGREGTKNPVSAYEPKIHLLRAHLSSLADERSDIQGLMNVHRSLVSSIHLIPPEVWAQIFSLCLPETRYIPWDSKFPPFTLGRVCWRWRAIVLSTPELWSSISLYIPNVSEGKAHPGWMSLFHAFLDRSGTLPASFEIIWQPAKYSQDGIFEEFLPTVIPRVISRVRHLSLSLPDRFVCMFWEEQMPLLESFRLGNEYTAIMEPPTLAGAPRLRSATFDSIYLQPFVWQLPWSNLTEFTSKSCHLDIQRAVHVLKWCPNLETCRMRVIPNLHNALFGVSLSPMDPDEKIVMKSLKSLAITIGTNENVFPLLDALNLPVLEHMEISCATSIDVNNGTRRIWPKPYILALVKRSSCQLRRLVFKNIQPLYDIELKDLVERVPSLVEFDASLDGRDALHPEIKEVLRRRRALAL
ncbi:hypothetical protein VNI00_011606 [Paramarasmius palmivorus]|uniref:F-box domain-containing protein n=1 Tax=Paramarasmius palmivorus TaxID=297713 RepID=A0AAW0CBY9_9AGAR